MTDDKEKREQKITQLFETLMAQAVKNNSPKMTNHELDEYMVRVVHLVKRCRVSVESNADTPREAILVLLLALVETHYTYTETSDPVDKLEHLLKLIAAAYSNIGSINEN